MPLRPKFASEQAVLLVWEDHRRVAVSRIQQIHIVPVIYDIHFDAAVLGGSGIAGDAHKPKI